MPDRPLDPAVLRGLIDHAETLTLPSPMLDRDVQGWLAEHVWGWPEKRIGPDASGENDCAILVPPDLATSFAYPPRGRVGRFYHVPNEPITGSTDAILKLIDAMRPTHRLILDKRPYAAGRNDGWRASVYREAHPYRSDRSDVPEAWMPTAALALCTAYLKARLALLAQQDTPNA